MSINLLKLVLSSLAALVTLMPVTVSGQGSIFGTVTNSGGSTPAVGEISFFGYLDDTDEEIRIESSVGAGYDAGNWYDDFQNYLTEAPGNPYDYNFFNQANGEGYRLSGLIPDNSYQREDVTLGVVSWPAIPTGLTAQVEGDTAVALSWESVAGLTYHIYRRLSASQGSLFRIDDPDGSLANPGVDGSSYTDTTCDTGCDYQYLIIAVDEFGNLSPHSEVVEVPSGGFTCGDADGNSTVNISDAVFLLAYIFGGGPAPDPYAAGDVDCTTLINISDVVYMIAYIFGNGPEPCASCS